MLLDHRKVDMMPAHTDGSATASPPAHFDASQVVEIACYGMRPVVRVNCVRTMTNRKVTIWPRNLSYNNSDSQEPADGDQDVCRASRALGRRRARGEDGSGTGTRWPKGESWDGWVNGGGLG